MTDHCAACSSVLPTQGDISGKTAGRKPLCEACCVWLDGLRTRPADLRVEGTPTMLNYRRRVLNAVKSWALGRRRR